MGREYSLSTRWESGSHAVQQKFSKRHAISTLKYQRTRQVSKRSDASIAGYSVCFMRHPHTVSLSGWQLVRQLIVRTRTYQMCHVTPSQADWIRDAVCVWCIDYSLSNSISITWGISPHIPMCWHVALCNFNSNSRITKILFIQSSDFCYKFNVKYVHRLFTNMQNAVLNNLICLAGSK